jgi:hypothetical protein
VKPEGKRQVGRPRRRWENNSKTDLKGKFCEGMDCITLARGREKRQDAVSKKINFRKTKETDGQKPKVLSIRGVKKVKYSFISYQFIFS